MQIIQFFAVFTNTAKNERVDIKNRMRVTFNIEDYDLNVVIRECPGDYENIVCNYYYESFKVTSDGHITKRTAESKV